jgi:hypothetical protein
MYIENPLSREAAKIGDLIPPGNYAFEVIDASDEISKSSGKDMIKLKLKIYMPDGRERIIFDYLMESVQYKLAHFFECVGLWDKYESGNVNADSCWGKSGELKIYIQKDKTGMYGDRSSVADYLPTPEQAAKKHDAVVAKAKGAEFVDSDLPF